MPVKRPQGVEPKFEVPNVQFVDNLVRRSLEINPKIREGLTTQQFLERLRQAAQGQPQAKAQAPATTADDHSAHTLALFMRERSEDFERSARDLRAELAKVQARQTELQQQTLAQVVEFLKFLYGPGMPEPKATTLKPFAAFLGDLGKSDQEILKEIVRNRGASKR